jgi:hypothetical protein
VAPTEVFFGAVVLIFVFIGLIRGFLRELGVTLVLMFLLFFLSRFEPELDRGMVLVMDAGVRVFPTAEPELLPCLLLMFAVAGTAFISYQGETLTYGGQGPGGGLGILLGALTGLVNGYLITGSLWYYMHKFDYPLKFLGFAIDRLSPVAQTLVRFLPISFLGQPVLLGQSLFLYLGILLLLARVIR